MFMVCGVEYDEVEGFVVGVDDYIVKLMWL